MSGEQVRDYVSANWETLVKIVGVVVKLGAVVVAVTLFVTQTASKDVVANGFAERPTRQQVIELIQGPANQYTMDQDVIMTVVTDYRTDMRRFEERLGTIQTDIARLITLVEIRSGPQRTRK
jgi:hypothetical protein